MKLLSTLLLYLIYAIPLQAQDNYDWWAAKHNWDGHTSWEQYMTMSTSFMGPNSLPVPEATKGIVDSSCEIEASADYYFSKGDKTFDFYTRGYLPLFENRMAVSIDVVPYEWFETDTITRDVRAARTESGKGGSGGDIYLYTDFQLIRNHRSLPDLLLQFAFRTASGTNLHNARHTDGPGYFFDLSGGKNIPLKNLILRPYLMGGFYAYQTFDLQHLQNDCILYGGGVDLSSKKIIFSQSLAGYYGYMNVGDRPLVYRASLRIKNKRVDWKVSYQWGVNDYDFQRIRLGAIFHFKGF